MTAATTSAAPAAALPAIGVAGPTSMVQVRNTDIKDFIKDYHIDTIRIPAGQSMIVMWDIMVYWLGNPSLVDENIRQRDRTREYQRVRVLYGAYDDDRVWEANRPRLEVYALTGERIWTVAEDPEGIHSTPANQSLAYAATYEQQIAVMQQQIDALQAMMAQQSPITPTVAPTPVEPTPVSGASVPPPSPAPPYAPPPVPSGPPPYDPTMPIGSDATRVTNPNPADNKGQWVDTTRPPVPLPPFAVDAPADAGPPEDIATGPRVS